MGWLKKVNLINKTKRILKLDYKPEAALLKVYNIQKHIKINIMDKRNKIRVIHWVGARFIKTNTDLYNKNAKTLFLSNSYINNSSNKDILQ